IRSIEPICVSLAALVEGYVLRWVLDVRHPSVVVALEDVLRLRTPFLFHHVKAELFTFWSLGIDPDLPNLYDTYLAAACLNLGKHHKRARSAPSTRSPCEEIADEKDLEEAHAHLLSLVGQCQHYQLTYPFSESKDELRDAFLTQDLTDSLTPRQ